MNREDSMNTNKQKVYSHGPAFSWFICCDYDVSKSTYIFCNCRNETNGQTRKQSIICIYVYKYISHPLFVCNFDV